MSDTWKRVWYMFAVHKCLLLVFPVEEKKSYEKSKTI